MVQPTVHSEGPYAMIRLVCSPQVAASLAPTASPPSPRTSSDGIISSSNTRATEGVICTIFALLSLIAPLRSFMRASSDGTQIVPPTTRVQSMQSYVTSNAYEGKSKTRDEAL